MAKNTTDVEENPEGHNAPAHPSAGAAPAPGVHSEYDPSKFLHFTGTVDTTETSGLSLDQSMVQNIPVLAQTRAELANVVREAPVEVPAEVAKEVVVEAAKEEVPVVLEKKPKSTKTEAPIEEEVEVEATDAE